MDNRDVPVLDRAAIKTEYFVLPDGRRLAYGRYGRHNGNPVYYFHGTPSSRLEAFPAASHAESAGIELFALDRPGCGASDPAEEYALLDWARDVEAFADSLGHTRFGIIGYSGGGSYSDAVAYALPDRLTVAYDLAGFAPVMQVEELQAHLAPLDRFFLRRSKDAGSSFRAPFALVGWAARTFGDRGFARLIRSSMGADDRELIMGNENVRRFLQAVVQDSFSQGKRGPTDDAIRCYGHWGFDLSQITFPIRLWHGTDDRFAPFHFAEYKARTIPRSELRVIEGRGHLHIATMFGELMPEIASRLNGT